MSYAITCALLVFIVALAIQKLPRFAWLAAGLLFVIITPIALPGFWPNGQWGISDWDYYFSYHTAIERIVGEQGLFPQWNPYICGGTSAVGDPEFPLFAPTFLLELIFGIPLGIRLAILSVSVFGSLGMLLLTKKLTFTPIAGLIAAIAYSFGSINLLELVEGHPNVFSAYYLPWIFWAWLSAYKSPRPHFWQLLCGIFLALTFFQGGIYMLMYVGCALIFLILALPQRLHALRLSLYAGLWALGLAAIKLVPVLLWLRQFQDKAYASSTYVLPSLHKILLGRFLHGSENVIPNQGGGWHEYGAYIGLTVLIVALISLIQLRQQRIRLLWLAALLAILIASSGPLLKPLFDAASFLPRSNISRFMILAVLPLSLLSGVGLQSLISKRRWALVPAALIVAVAAWELTSYAGLLSQQAFILNPTPTQSTPPAPIAYTINQHVIRSNGVDYSRAYAGAKAGWGTMSYCSVLGPEPVVRVIEDPEGSPYLTLPNNAGHAKLVSWTSQEIRIQADLAESSDIVLNSNYALGWWVTEITNEQLMPPRPANEVSGHLAATNLPAGSHTLVFTYHAPGFLRGILISSLTLLVAIAYLLYSLYNKVPERRT